MDWSFSINALFATIPVYILVVVGFFARKREIISAPATTSLSKFSIDIAIPCFILYNMLRNDKLRDIGLSLSAMSVGAGSLILGIAVSLFMARFVLGLKVGTNLRTFGASTGVQNYGFFVLSVLLLLFDTNGADSQIMGVALVHNVGCDLMFWSLCFLLLAQGVPFSLKLFLKAPIIAVFVGLFCVWTHLNDFVPDFLMNAFYLIGCAAIPLSLMLFGAMLYESWSFESFNFKLVGFAVFLRMLLLPAIMLGFAYILPVAKELKYIIILQAAAPASMTTAVLAKYFSGDPKLSIHIIFATLVVALITLPICLAIGFNYIIL
ncbi:MAG: AEC family transporter [Opitutales bacterium]